jgi:two-component system response regulator (stage 0 sporulation protein A)
VIRVLQLDPDEAFRSEVTTYFSRLDDFAYEGAGSLEDPEAIGAIDQPRIVLLDLDCPPWGGLAVLQQIRRLWSSAQTKVIMVSQTPPGERLLARAAELGADYFLLRPLDLVILEKRIRQLLQPAAQAPALDLSLRQVQEICAGYFERMGLPPNYKGYRYLIEGIWLAVQHPEWLQTVTRHLYPAIGQRFAVSGAQVERDMRYALEAAWEKGNLDQLYEIFPNISPNRGKPTNSEFISRMVHLVRLAAQLRG